MTEIEDKLVEGSSVPIQLNLFVSDAVPETPLAGDVELILRDRFGAAVPVAGDLAILDAELWQLLYTPAPGDLVAAKTPHTVRVRITNGSEVSFFPNARPNEWIVWPA